MTAIGTVISCGVEGPTGTGFASFADRAIDTLKAARRPSWGLRTPRLGGVVLPESALLDHMVGEALAYVQGESLKAGAALLTEAS